VEELVTNKSSHHLKLEEALQKNKEIIFQLPSNSLTVAELRRQTAKLIKKLTSEIQREYEEQEKLRKC
jgi:BarA-like signal transduction histidine kinase